MIQIIEFIFKRNSSIVCDLFLGLFFGTYIEGGTYILYIYIGATTPQAFGLEFEPKSVQKKIHHKPLVHTILKPKV